MFEKAAKVDTNEIHPVKTGKPLQAPKQGQSKGAILVIDDEKTVRSVTKIILERQGYQVLLAEDGAAGLELYANQAPEIGAILLDLTMPNMDGEEVFLQIRGICEEAKIILISGFHNLEVPHRLKKLGLAGFLQKPYLPQDLLNILRDILANPVPIEE